MSSLPRFARCVVVAGPWQLLLLPRSMGPAAAVAIGSDGDHPPTETSPSRPPPCYPPRASQRAGKERVGMCKQQWVAAAIVVTVALLGCKKAKQLTGRATEGTKQASGEQKSTGPALILGAAPGPAG